MVQSISKSCFPLSDGHLGYRPFSDTPKYHISSWYYSPEISMLSHYSRHPSWEFPTNLHYCWWEAMYIQLVPQLCQRFSHFLSTPLLLLWIALGTVFATNSSRVVWTCLNRNPQQGTWCKDLNNLKLTLVISPQFPHETIQPLVAVGLPCRAASSPVRGAPPQGGAPVG